MPNRGTGDGKDIDDVKEDSNIVKKSITEILGVNKKEVKEDDKIKCPRCGTMNEMHCEECENCHLPRAEFESYHEKKEEVKYPHMMYSPDGKDEVEVKDKAGHEKYAKKGYVHEKPKKKEEDAPETDSAKTIEPEVQKKKVLKGQDKPKAGPTSVTIKDSNGKTLSMTFKEMLAKVSTEEELLESPQQEIPMMMKQLHFICYASEEISEYLKEEGQDPEEWWQNKLAEVFSNVKSLYAYAKGDQMVNGKPLSAARMYTAAYEGIEAGKFELQNNEVIEISEEDADVLNKMFDELTETNTKEMYNVLIADEAGYNEILSFAKENL